VVVDGCGEERGNFGLRSARSQKRADIGFQKLTAWA